MTVKKHITIEIGTPEEVQLLSDLAELARVTLTGAGIYAHGDEHKRALLKFMSEIFEATR